MYTRKSWVLCLVLISAFLLHGCKQGSAPADGDDWQGCSDEGVYYTITNNTGTTLHLSAGYGDWCDNDVSFIKDGSDAGEECDVENGSTVQVTFQCNYCHDWTQKIWVNYSELLIQFGSYDGDPSQPGGNLNTNKIINTDPDHNMWIAATDGMYTVTSAGMLYGSCPPHQGTANCGKLFIDPFIDTANILAGVDDNKTIPLINIMGTHDSATYGIDKFYDYVAKCQYLTFTEQMEEGIRAFDLRLGVGPGDDNNGYLGFWHGSSSSGFFYCNMNLDSFLNAARDFLDAHPREVIFIMNKDENSTSSGVSRDFSQLYYSYMAECSVTDRVVAFENAEDIMHKTLGGLRGRIVIINRDYTVGGDGYIEGVPMFAGFGDDEAFDTFIQGYPVHVEDNYNVTGSGPKGKAGYILDAINKYDERDQTFLYVFSSAYHNTIPNPQETAKQVLPIVSNHEYLENILYRKVGMFMMDYVGRANGSRNIIRRASIGNLKDRRSDYTHSLKITGSYGGWTEEMLCPAGTYVSGFRQRVEKDQGKGGDDTALNAVSFRCRDSNGVYADDLIPWQGLWGDWSGDVECNSGVFMTDVRMKIEQNQDSGDDTGANALHGWCSDTGEIKATNDASWGDWSNWISCNTGEAICGLSVQYEPNQGDGDDDDTGMNGIRILCCSVPAGVK